MSIYRQNQAFFNQPYLLTEEQKQQPLEVIKHFFSTLKLYQAREDLATLKNVALISENLEFEEATKRADIIVFFDRIEELLEAAYLLIHGNE